MVSAIALCSTPGCQDGDKDWGEALEARYTLGQGQLCWGEVLDEPAPRAVAEALTLEMPLWG